jgi:stress-induced morphogen
VPLALVEREKNNGGAIDPASTVLYMAEDDMLRCIETAISRRLTDALRPAYLEVVNESFKHNVPKGSETHFKVTVVSNSFEGQSLLERHRLVNNLLSEEFKQGLHALSIQAKTPAQWESCNNSFSTPPCLGGDK